MSVFVINPGHCGCEPGGVSGKFIERELNLTVAEYLADMLKGYENVKIVLTRTENTPCNNVHISSGTLIRDIAAQNKADAIISIHHNAGGGIGSEVYYQTKNAKSKSLAQNMMSEYIAAGRKSRGIKNGDSYRLLNGTAITAVMSEYAFVDNAADRLAIDSDADLKAEAKAICSAIVKTYGLKLKQTEPAKPAHPETENLYRVGTGWSNGKCMGQVGAFAVKENALNFCDKHGAGYKVFDRNGKEVYPSEQQPSPEPSKPYKGMAVKLSGAKLYGSASSKTPANTVTGTYYLYDGMNIGGRYRITISKDRCGKTPVGENVTGYVDAVCVKA